MVAENNADKDQTLYLAHQFLGWEKYQKVSVCFGSPPQQFETATNGTKDKNETEQE